MNKRLQTVLDIEHITASQLADTLGIQRGGVSHLLSGRNKPSFDFLEKILRKYPEINAEWLITGKGKPINSNSVSNTSDNNGQITDIQNSISDYDSDYDLFGNQYYNNNQPAPAPDRDTAPPAGISQSPPPRTQTPVSPSPYPAASDKKPVRIIIYFSDGTYSEFYPN